LELPKFVTKVAATWAAIGSLLIIITSQGVSLPTWVVDLFSQTFVDEALKLLGAIIDFLAFAKLIFGSKASESEISILSVAAKKKFAFNPFKVTLRDAA